MGCGKEYNRGDYLDNILVVLVVLAQKIRLQHEYLNLALFT
jgi:hypothetical protein